LPPVSQRAGTEAGASNSTISWETLCLMANSTGLNPLCMLAFLQQQGHTYHDTIRTNKELNVSKLGPCIVSLLSKMLWQAAGQPYASYMTHLKVPSGTSRTSHLRNNVFSFLRTSRSTTSFMLLLLAWRMASCSREFDCISNALLNDIGSSSWVQQP